MQPNPDVAQHDAYTSNIATQPTMKSHETICEACQAIWSGINTSHCAACHITTTGIKAFDAHRHYGKCRTPEDSGLVWNGKAWDMPPKVQPSTA